MRVVDTDMKEGMRPDSGEGGGMGGMDPEQMHLMLAKAAVWKIANHLLKGDYMVHSPNGKKLKLTQVKDMLDKANSKDELETVWNELGLELFDPANPPEPFDPSLNENQFDRIVNEIASNLSSSDGMPPHLADLSTKAQTGMDQLQAMYAGDVVQRSTGTVVGWVDKKGIFYPSRPEMHYVKGNVPEDCEVVPKHSGLGH